MVKDKKILILNIFLVIVLLFVLRNNIIDSFFNKTLVIVPNVVNLPKDEAIQVLKKAKLDANIISSRSSDVPVDFVFSQMPKANTQVKKNRGIKIYINDMKSNEIPNLVGQTLTQAMMYLQKNNIDIKRVDYIHTEDSEDIVLAVYPSAKKMGIGEKISLLVSSKEMINKNKMPDIIGLDVNEANRVLAQIGLKIENISRISNTTYPENAIVSSEPSVDMPINPNTKISVVISEKSATAIEREKIKQESIDEIIKKALDDEKSKGSEEN